MKGKFVIFTYFVFVFSGLIKWLPLPLDPTILSFVILVFVVVMNSNLKINKNEFYVILSVLLFLAFCLISITYTQSELQWQKKILGGFLGMMALLFPILLKKHFKNYTDVFSMALLFYWTGLALFILEYYLNGLSRVLNSEMATKIPGYLNIGMFMGFGVLLSLNSKKSSLKYGGIILGSLSLVLLGGRGPAFVVLVFLVLNIFHIRGFKLNKVLIVLGAIVVLTQLDFKNNQYLDRSIGRFSNLTQDVGSGSVRGIHIMKAIEIFEEAPIFGIGLGGYGLAIYHSDVWAYPHVIYLEVLSELGIIGFFLFLFVLAFSFKAINFSFFRFDNSIWLVFLFFFFNALKSGSYDTLRLLLSWLGLLIVIEFEIKYINDRYTGL